DRSRQRAGDQQHEQEAHVYLAAGEADRPRRHVRANGVEVAVGHVHDPHHAVDERETGGDEEEDRRVEQRVEDLCDQRIHEALRYHGSDTVRVSAGASVPLTTMCTSAVAPAGIPSRPITNRPLDVALVTPARTTAPSGPTIT